MTTEGHKFYVIYNRAANPMARTEDTDLSLEFTTHVVSYLESMGHTGFYADRDAIPGRNIFSALENNIKAARRTILVVTPRFQANGWESYSGQRALKEYLDTKKTDKLIPIGLDIPDDMKLPELNVSEWIHFTKDFKNEDKKLNMVKEALENDGKWNQQPAYQAQLHAREHGDNRLRTESDKLMTQPSTSVDCYEFFTDKFLMDLAENFPRDWKELAIHLGEPDHIVLQVESDNPRSVKQQAYYALKYWKTANPGTEEEMLVQLQGVLRVNMKRNDLANNIDKEYQVFKASREDCGEPDALTNRSTHQTRVKEPVGSQQTVNSNNSATARIVRELKVERASATQSRPELQEQQIPQMSSITLQEGPSLSLPSASVFSRYNSVQSKQAAGITNAESDNRNGINADHVSQQQMENLKSVATTDRPNKRNDFTHNASQQPNIEMDKGSSENGNNFPDRKKNTASDDARYKMGTRETENVMAKNRGEKANGHNVRGDNADYPNDRGDNADDPNDRGDNADDLNDRGDNADSPNDRGDNADDPNDRGDNADDPNDRGDNADGHNVRGDNADNPNDRGDNADDPNDRGDNADGHNVRGDYADDPNGRGDKADGHNVTAETGDSRGSSRQNPALVFGQQSISQDSDLTADALGSFSFSPNDGGRNSIPGSLPVKQGLPGNLNSPSPSTDSGYSHSIPETPIDNGLVVAEEIQPVNADQLHSKAQPVNAEQLQSNAVSEPLLKDDVDCLQNNSNQIQAAHAQTLEEDTRNHQDTTGENSNATTEHQISDGLPISPTLQSSDDTAELNQLNTNAMSSQKNGGEILSAYQEKKKSDFGFSGLTYLSLGLGVILVSIIIYKKLKT